MLRSAGTVAIVIPTRRCHCHTVEARRQSDWEYCKTQTGLKHESNALSREEEEEQKEEGWETRASQLLLPLVVVGVLVALHLL